MLKTIMFDTFDDSITVTTEGGETFIVFENAVPNGDGRAEMALNDAQLDQLITVVSIHRDYAKKEME